MRNAALDFGRLAASVGIVLFHSGGPGAAVGYAGLYFFVILIALFGPFGDKAGDQRRFAGFASTRAERLLIPWVFWSAIYGLLKLAQLLWTGGAFSDEFAIWMVFTGPALHLWFLPFAFVSSLGLWVLAPYLHRSAGSPKGQFFVLGGLMLACTLTAMLPCTNCAIPLAQYCFAAPSLCLGLAFSRPVNNVSKWALMAVTTGLLWRLDLPGSSLQMIIAGWATLLCFTINLPANRFSRGAAKMSLIVYLIHPLVMSVAEHLLRLPQKGTQIALVTLIGSIAFALIVLPLAARLPPRSLVRRSMAA